MAGEAARRPAGAVARVTAAAARERGDVRSAALLMATRVTKRRRFILRESWGMVVLLGSWKPRVQRRHAVDQRTVGPGVLQQGDGVSLDPHPSREDGGRGEHLAGENLAPDRKRSPQGEAGVRMRGPGDELDPGAPPPFEPHEE